MNKPPGKKTCENGDSFTFEAVPDARGKENSATRLSSFFADIRHKDRAQQSGKPPHQRPVRLVFVCQGARMKAPQTAVEQGRIHQGWMVGQEQNGLGVIHGAHFFQALYPNTVAE